MVAVTLIGFQIPAQGDTVESVAAYKQLSCMGELEVFHSVAEMLNSIERGNNWKSFQITMHTTSGPHGHGPISSSTSECDELTPEKIADLKIVDGSMEEIVVTGIRLSGDYISRFDTAWTSLNNLKDGEIPITLFNQYLEALEKSFKEFEKNLKKCLLRGIT